MPDRELSPAPLTQEQMDKLVELVRNPEQAMAALPQAERDEYARCQKSVIDARRSAEREGWRYVI